jgi:hypothetical protein
VNAPLWDRFWSKVDATGDCWKWRASKDKRGYGKFKVGGKSVPAHRVAWELLVGPCPDNLEPDHLCRNESCVNVGNHIEWVTSVENGRRSYSLQAINARKTHCPKGHAYTENNIYRMPGKPNRYCKECHKIRTRDSQRLKRQDSEYRKDQNEKNKERMKDYRQRHPITPEQHARRMELQRERRTRHRVSLTIEPAISGTPYPFP